MFTKSLVGLILAPALALATAYGQSDSRLRPIESLPRVEPRKSLFDQLQSNRPTLLRSAEVAERYFANGDLTQLKKQVDFDRQVIAVFAWRGSPQDTIRYAVLESFPEQVVFSFEPGDKNGDQPRTMAFALRSNVRWRVNESSFDAIAAQTGEDVNGEYIKVRAKGKLDSQVAAIGGETTGVVITANEVTLELELGDNQKLRNKAEELHGSTVVVTGELIVRQGVERGARWIVEVDTLQLPGDDGDENPYLTADGRLHHALILRDSQMGFAGESGHLWTIQPDGSWRHQTFLNDEVREPSNRGTLDQQKLKSLAESLAQYDLLGLPDQMGKRPGANPHVISIEFGKTTSRMILRAGVELPKPVPGKVSTPRQRFAMLVRLLRESMTQN